MGRAYTAAQLHDGFGVLVPHCFYHNHFSIIERNSDLNRVLNCTCSFVQLCSISELYYKQSMCQPVFTVDAVAQFGADYYRRQALCDVQGKLRDNLHQ